MVADGTGDAPRAAPGVSLRKGGGPGVSLRKGGGHGVLLTKEDLPDVVLRKPAAAEPAVPKGPAPEPQPQQPAPPPADPGATRPRRPRTLSTVLVAVAVAGVVLGLARPAHHLLDVVAAAAGRSASATSAGPTAAAVTAAASRPGAAPSAAGLDDVPLESMLLGSGALPAGITVAAGVPIRAFTLDAYRDGYTGTMTPVACARLRGIMAFSGEADTGGAVIGRADDLRLGEVTGSQQVRRFASPSLASAFLDEQRAWFADCGVSTFEQPNGSIAFDGSVDADLGDVLLASADDVDPERGDEAEFDGWVRRGDVVFGAYLIGWGADRDALRRAGRALIDAAGDRLTELG